MKKFYCRQCGRRTKHVLRKIDGVTWNGRGKPKKVTLEVYVCSVCGEPRGV